jgi:hypothetical protein
VQILPVSSQNVSHLLLGPSLQLLDFTYGAFQGVKEIRRILGGLADLQLDISPVDLW